VTSRPAVPPGTGAAPRRSQAGVTRPRRLSHILLFSPDVLRSVRFYCDALGLRLSDHSGDIVAFLHGAHASDHHMLAFAKSDGPGLHHSSWDVPDIDAVGIGMEQMAARGYTQGWGVGRHVIGSNYFRYVRDPWGSLAEYSAEIDFIPADLDWKVGDYPPEDSFYVWGPPVPDDFVTNHETAVRRAAG
jgi:catechol 2,3-dioxygenase-like lactoylglutathione lyase family enzyme